MRQISSRSACDISTYLEDENGPYQQSLHSPEARKENALGEELVQAVLLHESADALDKVCQRFDTVFYHPQSNLTAVASEVVAVLDVPRFLLRTVFALKPHLVRRVPCANARPPLSQQRRGDEPARVRSIETAASANAGTGRRSSGGVEAGSRFGGGRRGGSREGFRDGGLGRANPGTVFAASHGGGCGRSSREGDGGCKTLTEGQQVLPW
jgi:hypothetical protein